ncbi:MAG: DNA polymerase III subunit [Ruminococcaceae bacterium]|nr:DNA polymerase III subunit [Oscillospiraceae bacterium]
MIFPLVGNKGVENSIIHLLSTNHFPHAVIIEGEALSGKSILTSYIASSLFCEEENAPCGKCRACSLVKAGTHPDLFLTTLPDKKKNIAVEQIRKLKVDAYIRPQMSDKKVFIIDYADTMNPQSQNAILKVLEEPPGDTVFILQVRSRSALLPTILSRCVTYTLSDPDINESAEYLRDKHGIDLDEAKEILKQNNNSIGRSENALKNKKSGVYTIASEYLDIAFDGGIYDLIALTAPLEKDRNKAGEFYSHLSYLLLTRIKNSAISKNSIKRDSKYLEIVKDAQEALKTNINLTLLFCETAAKFKS